jgi:hypothetical protein
VLQAHGAAAAAAVAAVATHYRLHACAAQLSMPPP